MTTATAPCGRFAARFLEPVGEHGLGVMHCPSVREHLIETWIVIVQAEQQFTQVGPRFDAVTPGAGEDCEQDGRAGPGLLAAQEQPDGMTFSEKLTPPCRQRRYTPQGEGR